jgi:hypothetical protein
MTPHQYAVCLCLTFLWTNVVLGQATFRLQNLHTVYGIDAPVFDATGTPLAGSNFRAELWGGAVPDALAPASNLRLGGARYTVAFVTDGYFFSSEAFLAVPSESTGGGGYAWVQVRAWDTRLGASYDDVAALDMGGYGESPLFRARGGDPFIIPAEAPGPLIGLQSFSLRPVPEPTLWLLLALGGVPICLAARRRRP